MKEKERLVRETTDAGAGNGKETVSFSRKKIKARAFVKGLALSQPRPVPFLIWSHVHLLIHLFTSTPDPSWLSVVQLESYHVVPTNPHLLFLLLPFCLHLLILQLLAQWPVLYETFHSHPQLILSCMLLQPLLSFQSIYRSLFVLCVYSCMRNYLITVCLPHITGSSSGL